jgi:hypothetical protein
VPQAGDDSTAVPENREDDISGPPCPGRFSFCGHKGGFSAGYCGAWSTVGGLSHLFPAMTICPSYRLRIFAQPNTWSTAQNEGTSSVSYSNVRRKSHPLGGKRLERSQSKSSAILLKLRSPATRFRSFLHPCGKTERTTAARNTACIAKRQSCTCQVEKDTDSYGHRVLLR